MILIYSPDLHFTLSNLPSRTLVLYGVSILEFDANMDTGAEGQRIYNGWFQPALSVLMEKREPGTR